MAGDLGCLCGRGSVRGEARLQRTKGAGRTGILAAPSGELRARTATLKGQLGFTLHLQAQKGQR